MIHKTSPKFWKFYSALPQHIRIKADKQFETLKKDADHPSLNLKPVGRYWSARVDLTYRAVAIRENDELLWFWIGIHGEYDRLIK